MIYRIRDTNPKAQNEDRRSLFIAYLQDFDIKTDTTNIVRINGYFFDIEADEISSDCVLALNEAGFWIYTPLTSDCWKYLRSGDSK